MPRYTHQDQFTVGGLNSELEKVEQAFKDMISRVGDTPNALTADVDANSSRIINLPEPASNSEPLTLGKGQAILDDATAEANRALAQANRAEDEADRADNIVNQKNIVYVSDTNEFVEVIIPSDTIVSQSADYIELELI